MSLNITCYICNKELEEPGQLLFSSPMKDETIKWAIQQEACPADFARIIKKHFWDLI